MKLYKLYVRPHLEFAATAWAPWTAGDKERLEKVQERAIRAVSGLKGKTYEERLKELEMLSLEERRNEMDLVQTYKILNRLDDVDPETWFRRPGSIRPTRANTGAGYIVPQRARLEIRDNFYSCRATRAWNRLPDEIRAAPTLGAFRGALCALRKSSARP